MSVLCLEVPHLVDEYVNPHVQIPYGLKVDETRAAMQAVYLTLHDINTILYERLGRRLEDTVLGNSLSGLISELLVRLIADSSPALVRNERVGGHPDLLPAGHYDAPEVLHGREGIELKSSIQRGGWQGHNPEESWIMVF